MNNDKNNIETVFITGASRGIGLELTRQFLGQGYRVIATFRGQPSAQLSSLLPAGELTLAKLEMTDGTSIAHLAKTLSGDKIDILINNAGVIGPTEQALETVNPQDWLHTFAVNTIAPLMLSRALLGQLRSSSSPRIVTLSSHMGALNSRGMGMYAYRTSKAAVNKAMQTLAAELKPEGIVACPIDPGWVKTDMGGDAADLSVEESASGIVHLVRHLTIEQSGTFLTWQGKTLAW